MPLRVVYGLIDKGLLHASRLFIEGEAPKGWPVEGATRADDTSAASIEGEAPQAYACGGGDASPG